MQRKNVLYVVLVVLVAVGLGIAIGHDQLGKHETEVVTVAEVPIPGPDDPIIDPDQQQTDAERPEGIDAHEDAKDETPPGVDQEDVQKIVQSDPAGIGPARPVGGAQLLSCRDHFVRNFSDRAAGSTVSMFVNHYTVSSTTSFDAIWNLFNTPSFGASSTYLLSVGGRCERLVPNAKKAWTQGAFNSVSESVEIVCCTSDPSRSWWIAQPIIKNRLLASLILDRLRARGLPLRLVNPEGCTPLAGYTDHTRLECGNTHTDVGRNFPWDVLAVQIRELANPDLVTRWQVRSGGILLNQAGRYSVLIDWMKGPGADKVKAAEKQNDAVRIVKVAIPAS